MVIDTYTIGPNSWDYTRGRVQQAENKKVIADVKRNYVHFWHAWIQHANENEYLPCGEDYQGQTVINLTQSKVHNFFPDAGHEGFGFCWTAAFPSPDSKILAVDGCYWGAPNDVAFFDFSEPDRLPYKEYLRVRSVVGCDGWVDDNRFKLTREIEVRKPDGKPYEELSDAEQDEVDDKGLCEYVEHELTITRDQILRGSG